MIAQVPILQGLPPEIWRFIFRLSTAIEPFILDTSPIPPLTNEMRAFKYDFDNSMGAHALRTKRTLILVCKTWRHLALEYLYEFIWIWKPDELFSLLSLIRSEVHDTDPISHNPARFIKHLFLSLGSFVYPEYKPKKQKIDEAFITLFSLCRDLRILRVATGGFQLNYPVIGDLNSNLRSLDVQWDDDLSDSPSWCHTLMTQLPQHGILEALCLTFLGSGGLLFGFPEAPLSFPRLYFLGLEISDESEKERILSLMAHWQLPRLVDLSFDCREDRFQGSSVAQFFCSFGSNLTSLNLDMLEDDEAVMRIVEMCPNVQNLHILFNRPQPPYTPFPHARQLQRLQFSSRDWEAEERYGCFAFIDAIEGIYLPNRPSLRVIQLTDMTHTELISHGLQLFIDKWNSWSHRLQENGIRFEDSRGTLIGARDATDMASSEEV
jgi:hypothetical protein